MGPFDAIKMYLLFRKDKKAALEETNMNGQVKPGWKTSEFWLTLLAQAPMIASVILGKDSQAAQILSALSVAAYSVSRTLHKNSAADNASISDLVPGPKPVDPATEPAGLNG